MSAFLPERELVSRRGGKKEYSEREDGRKRNVPSLLAGDVCREGQAGQAVGEEGIILDSDCIIDFV